MLTVMNRLFATLIIGLCAPFPALVPIQAQAQTQPPPQDALAQNPRYAPCFQKSRKKPDWAVCEELIPVLLKQHAAGIAVSGFVSCVPAHTQEQDVRETFDAWISKRPHFAKYTAWDTLSGGLSVLYKCPN